MSKCSCNMVKDLLPLYIDDVVSPETKSEIENHLSECEACKKIYESMKEDLPGVVSQTDSAKEEKRVIEKVNEKIEKDNRKVKLFYLGLCVLILLILFILNLPIKSIPDGNWNADVEHYDLVLEEGVASKALDKVWSDNTLFFYPDGKNMDDCFFIKCSIESLPGYEIAIDKDYWQNGEKNMITRITVSSDYDIRKYSSCRQDEDTVEIAKLKTTLFGRNSGGVMSEVEWFEIGEIKAIEY